MSQSVPAEERGGVLHEPFFDGSAAVVLRLGPVTVPEFSGFVEGWVPFVADWVHARLIEAQLEFDPVFLEVVKVGGPPRLEFSEPLLVVVRETSDVDAGEVVHAVFAGVQLGFERERSEKRPVRELVAVPVHAC